ncbi:MAG: DNA polymerase III subunit delta [Actinomycetota bacterium]|nr:DNA polymerase III subunit delta [Actinomycetota bacterium]
MTTAPATGASSAFLVRGDDPSLVAQEAHGLITRLVGDADPGLVVEEHGAPGADGIDVGAVIDACTTPPFLVERRVVVVRDAGRLTATDAARLVAYLADPLPSTSLVLVGGGGTVPQSLVKAVGSAGGMVEASAGTGKARSQWFADHVRHGPVRLDGAAAALLADHLGEDLGRLAGLLDSLAAAYGPGASVTAAELAPFLGGAGAVAPWDLTDAVAAGDTARALAVLRRLLDSGFHPLAVLTVLHRRFEQVLRLDGSGAVTPDAAASLLGLRSSFPARKALEHGRRIGTDGVARALQLLAAADLDLRGSTGLPGEAVVEILVARLSRLARPARRGR